MGGGWWGGGVISEGLYIARVGGWWVVGGGWWVVGGGSDY